MGGVGFDPRVQSGLQLLEGLQRHGPHMTAYCPLLKTGLGLVKAVEELAVTLTAPGPVAVLPASLEVSDRGHMKVCVEALAETVEWYNAGNRLPEAREGDADKKHHHRGRWRPRWMRGTSHSHDREASSSSHTDGIADKFPLVAKYWEAPPADVLVRPMPVPVRCGCRCACEHRILCAVGYACIIADARLLQRPGEVNDNDTNGG